VTWGPRFSDANAPMKLNGAELFLGLFLSGFAEVTLTHFRRDGLKDDRKCVSDGLIVVNTFSM
jgi:hypothetical protein